MVLVGRRQGALHLVDGYLVDEDGDASGHRCVKALAVVDLELRLQPPQQPWLPRVLEQRGDRLGDCADRLKSCQLTIPSEPFSVTFRSGRHAVVVASSPGRHGFVTPR